MKNKEKPFSQPPSGSNEAEGKFGKSELEQPKFSTIDMQVILNDNRSLKIENDRLKARVEKQLTSQSQQIESLQLSERRSKETIGELVELLKRARLYVEYVWAETAGTEREGTAMGSRGVLNDINEVFRSVEQSESNKGEK